MLEKLGTTYDWVRHDPSLTRDEMFHRESHEFVDFFSENHLKAADGKYRSGGFFQTTKNRMEHRPSNDISVIRPGNGLAYSGRFIVDDDLAKPSNPLLVDLDSLGPAFYNAARPDKPVMGLANSIFELKDVPGMLRQRFLDGGFDHFFGSVYLAYKFGWAPLLSDVRKLYEAQRGIYSRLNQLLKDNGKPVNRRINGIKSEEKSLISEHRGGFPPLYPAFVTQCYGSNSDTLIRKESIKRTREWFSGQFVYWLPPKGNMPDWEWRRWMIARLYGLNVTPGAVYKAIPWSWLVDWFSTAGDAVANMDAGVTARTISNYAYVMGHQEDIIRTTVTGSFMTSDTSSTLVTAVRDYGYDIKRRTAASPFGFNFLNKDLDPTQLQILAAIGATRR